MTQRRVDRHALVTGAAKRVGRAIALGSRAAAAGRVAVHYRNVRSRGARGRRQQFARTGARRGGDPRRSGPAGGGRAALPGRPADSARPPALPDQQRVRVRAPQQLATSPAGRGSSTWRSTWARRFFCSHRVSFGSCPRQKEGNVINIIDERVWNLTPHFVSYTLSKSALWTLTRVLAPALAPRVRINGIGPVRPCGAFIRPSRVSRGCARPCPWGEAPRQPKSARPCASSSAPAPRPS